MNKAITFIMACGLVVILGRGSWNELTGHLKDRGKDNLNSRRILSNLEKMM
jgi:ribosomal protein S15P/S13E